MEANLTNRDAVLGPQPYVKWSHEPPRAQDVPQAIARAIHHASLPPRGPAFVSIPMDDWDAEADEDRRQERARARCDGVARCPTRSRSTSSRELLRRGAQPGARRGPGHRRERRLGRGGRARREAAPAGVGDARARRRAPRLPRGPPELPRRPAARDRPAVGDARGPRPGARRRLLGVPLLPLHPRPAAAGGRHARADHERPERGGARADGQRDRRRRGARAASGCSSCSAPPSARRPQPRPLPGEPARGRPDERLDGDGGARRGLAARTGSRSSRRRRARSRCATACACRSPGSYYFSSSGGLGFGIAAAVGVQLAQPRAPGRVRARRGLGAVRDHGAVDGRRLPRAGHVPGAAQRGVHDPQVVRRARAGDRRCPGLDLPGLDVASVAEAYGVPAAGGRRAARSSPRRCARRSPCRTGPRLVQVPVASGMWLD